MEYKIHCYFCSHEKFREEYVFGETTVKLVSHGEKCKDINFSVQGDTTYELIIESTESPSAIHKIVDLLCSSYALINGYNSYNSDDLIDHIIPESEKEASFWAGRNPFYAEVDDCWYFALLLAEKAYGNSRMINAIMRYYSAHKIVNLHPMDLHPYNDPMKDEYLLSDQMGFANCIMACYAALEEVCMNVDLKKGRGLLNQDATAWNPEIYNIVSNKLKSIGIDPAMELMWLSRGENAAPSKDVYVKIIRNCEWSYGDINDYYTTPVDALLRIKQLRNKAGAHNDAEGIGLLSIYDVENAFHISRSLLLLKFGIYSLLMKS